MRTIIHGLMLFIALGAAPMAYADADTDMDTHNNTLRVTVDGLVCSFCAQGIDKSLRRLPATEDVYVSLQKRLVAVALRDGQNIDDALLTKTLKDAGYTVRAIDRVTTPISALRDDAQ